MKYSFAIAALAVAVQAQSLGDVPKCAVPCLDDAIASKTKCDKTDLVCVCKDFADVRTAATSCVIEKCGSDVAINEVLPATEKLCKNPQAGGSGGEKESTKAETTKVETSTKVVVTTSAEAVETTAAETETKTVPPVVESTTKVVPPIVNTPTSAAPTKTEAGGAGSTPAPTNVGENSAAGLKGLGAMAMAALAALAL